MKEFSIHSVTKVRSKYARRLPLEKNRGSAFKTIFMFLLGYAPSKMFPQKAWLLTSCQKARLQRAAELRLLLIRSRTSCRLETRLQYAEQIHWQRGRTGRKGWGGAGDGTLAKLWSARSRLYQRRFSLPKHCIKSLFQRFWRSAGICLGTILPDLFDFSRCLDDSQNSAPVCKFWW